MRLYEFQAKRIFQKYGIAIPNGHVARSIDEIAQVSELFKKPLALKAQVLAGGLWIGRRGDICSGIR